MALSRISPQDIINFSWSALCWFLFSFSAKFFRKHSEGKLHNDRCTKDLREKKSGGLLRLIVCFLIFLVSFAFLRCGQQKDDNGACCIDVAHMLFLRIGCRHQLKEGANLTCVSSIRRRLPGYSLTDSLYTLASLTFELVVCRGEVQKISLMELRVKDTLDVQLNFFICWQSFEEIRCNWSHLMQSFV